MPFYQFRQNNSGGTFRTDPDRGISIYVIVEAIDYADANARANKIGIYFNGVDNGVDCSCCGDRWRKQTSFDAGDLTPMIYDRPVGDGKFYSPVSPAWSDDGIEAYIHYMDGRVVPVRMT